MTDCLLVGAGNMSREYAKVFASLEMQPIVLGRGAESAAAFEAHTGLKVHTGELEAQLQALENVPSRAVVSVNAQYLAEVSVQLMKAGVKHLLIEKPGGLDRDELLQLNKVMTEEGANIYIGYNRRLMASILKVQEIVREDGGINSLKFDFSEPAHIIAKLNKPERELRTWFYGNSSHVVDLAFFLFGKPETLSGTVTRSVSWHPDGGIFAGFAKGQNDSLMSWHANWTSPGRWGMEVLTPKRRLILQPLEKVRAQDLSSFAEHEIEIDDQIDLDFKPGLKRQLDAFFHEPSLLKPLAEHIAFFDFYEVVRNGGSYGEQ